MGTKTYDGVWFISYSHDHLPPHVHGQYGGVTVIVDLLEDGGVARSSRTKAVLPANAKRRDIRKVLRVAIEYAAELHQLWEATHGTTA